MPGPRFSASRLADAGGARPRWLTNGVVNLTLLCILIVLLGVLVLILALGVFLPMWNLGQAALGSGNR